jgi:hypothetical protein
MWRRLMDYPVAAGGFLERDNDLAIAWSILGRVEPEHFVGLVRAFRKYMRPRRTDGLRLIALRPSISRIAG